MNCKGETNLISSGYHPHDVLMRLQVISIQPTARAKRIKATANVLTADLLDLAAERNLVDLVGKVIVVRLHVHRVSG